MEVPPEIYAFELIPLSGSFFSFNMIEIAEYQKCSQNEKK